MKAARVQVTGATLISNKVVVSSEFVHLNAAMTCIVIV